MQNYPKHMKMSELSEYTQIPASTIWYYARLGLLPAPVKNGRKKAYYTAEHIEILKQIRDLKENGQSLKNIGEFLKVGYKSPENNLETNIIYTSKRDGIVKAAIELFYKKGYNNTTIKDIVTSAGSGKITFYKYFKDKQELFLECAEHVFFDIGRDLTSDRDERDGFERLWNRALNFHRHHAHMIDMLNLLRGGTAIKDKRFEPIMEKVILNLIIPIEKDLLSARNHGQIFFKDIRGVAHLLVGASEYFFYYLQNHPEKGLDDSADKARNILLDGVKSVNQSEMADADSREESFVAIDANKPELPASNKRDLILSISTKLFLEKGFAETSTIDIAQNAKVSKETIYQHFKNKEEIFMACADTIFLHMYDEVWGDIKEEKNMFLRLTKRGKIFFSSYNKWIPMMNLVKGLSVGDNASFKAKFHQVIMQMVKPMMWEINSLVQDGRFRKNIDIELAAFMLLGMSEFGAQIAARGHDSTDGIISNIITIFVEGLPKL